MWGALLLTGAMVSSEVRAATWHSSLEDARVEADATGRPILVNFTGSDWCPACMQLRSSALNSPLFQRFVEKRVVLLEVDFPRGRRLPAAQQQANETLASKYGVRAFPTLLLIGANGRTIDNVPAYPSAPQLIAALTQTLATVPTAVNRTGGGNPDRSTAPFAGAATKPLPAYTNLTVKSIAGPPTRRFALINNTTMAPGDSASLKVGTNRVLVQCVEIREKSVVVRVDRDPATRELVLSDILK